MSKASCRKLISRIGNFRGFHQVSYGKDHISFLTLGIPTNKLSQTIKRNLIKNLMITLQPDYYILRVEKQNSTSNYHYHILAANITDYITTSLWYKWLRKFDILPSKEIRSLMDAKDLVLGQNVRNKDIAMVCNYLKKNPKKQGKEFEIVGSHWSSSLNLKFGPLVTEIPFKELMQLDNGSRKVYSIFNLPDKEVIGSCICDTPVTFDMLDWYRLHKYNE